ncbi:MAG: AMP-binding protein [Burkholderiales bacterium]|jgi:long-chain acyl-CoA synthetase|nr:AMP-binding protein [Burkholderiales bacterium]
MTDATVRAAVDAQAAARPDAPYFISPEAGCALAFGALHASAHRLHGALASLGAKPGDKIALYMGNGIATAQLFVGAMYAGYTIVPLNLLAQGAQLEYVLGHCDARLVFVAPDEMEKVAAAAARLAQAPRLVPIDPDATHLFADAAPAPLPPVRESDDALMMYTSGTTGRPKGVVLAHSAVIAGGRFVTEAHALGSADRVLGSLPLYHINGQIVQATSPLIHGGSLVMPHRFSASAFWRLAAAHRCTWINVVPTIISYLLAGPDPRAEGIDISAIRFCRSASAPLAPEHHRAFEAKFGIGVIETMGLTETAAPCFTNPLAREQRKVGSPGRAFGNEAKVVAPDGRACGARESGEIMVRGANVMKGYYKSPEETAKALEPDGWLHTGDLGYLDDEGFVFVTGRLKELIIKGGENIAPREVDEALIRHPAVLEAAAVGIPDPHYGQEIFACVILKPGERVGEEDLKAFCRAEIGPYKTPRMIRVVDELPRGPSGKVQRLKLVELANA